MESMDPKKIQDELDKEQTKISVGLSLNEHYYTEFQRICDSRKPKRWKYNDTLDKLIKEFVHEMNPKFK
jgi:hypothetical protein